MKNVKLVWVLALLVSVFSGCSDKDDDPVVSIPEPTSLTTTLFVDGLKFPLGGDLDSKKNLWITELGTGNDDGRVVMITPGKKVVPVINGLKSMVANGSIEGLSHVKVHNNILYIMHGIGGVLYKLDISNFNENSQPVDVASVQSFNFREFVDAQKLVEPLNSNGYDIAIGPNNDLFITDAGSNAIIRVTSSGAMSVFARFPNLASGSEAVPTGIRWDGTDFYVTSLTGFPFAPSAATIYKVSSAGVVSQYKSGLSLLSNLEFTAGKKIIATQLGVFGAMGFGPTDGKVVNEEGKILAEGFGMPTDLIKVNDREFYIVNYLSGKIDKLTY